MLTMTSRAAKNQFGTLIDTSQRRPVTVTRHGRPVAVVQSYADYLSGAQAIPFHVAALIGDSYPLRGKVAAESMHLHLAKMSKQAAKDGLSEADAMRMLNQD